MIKRAYSLYLTVSRGSCVIPDRQSRIITVSQPIQVNSLAAASLVCFTISL